MPRWACVELPAFPLQLLLRRNAAWKGGPAAVVDEDRPQGRVLHVNAAAARLGVRTGQRFAAALSLARELRAGVVDEREIRSGADAALARLRAFSPSVESAPGEAGLYFCDASGLTPGTHESDASLYPSLGAWGDAVRSAMAGENLVATVACGFTRFGVFAAARLKSGVTVLATAEEEKRFLSSAPLARLAPDPASRDWLARLGVGTVGAFLALPRSQLAGRLPLSMRRLHDLASGEAFAPLQNKEEVAPARVVAHLDNAEDDLARLLFDLKRRLDPLLEMLAKRGHAAASLSLSLVLDRVGKGHRALVFDVKPATPTLDPVQLMDLLHLRLASLELSGGVTDYTLLLAETGATQEQLALFASLAKRDPEAGKRAVARLRAEFGEDAAAYASPRSAHLPEASFAFELEPTKVHISPRRHGELRRATEEPGSPSPLGEREEPSGVRAISSRTKEGEGEGQFPSRRRSGDASTLIRRIYSPPKPLPPVPRLEPEAWFSGVLPGGAIVRKTGPWVVSGGWWGGGSHREYHYLETLRGDIYWVFYDKRRRRWFLHGRVE